jgi:AraC family ethanolamine operon transcriptional activator
MATRTTLGDDHIVVARINAVGSGSRWCGIDLAPGMVFVYAPSAEHTAANRPGLEFTFAKMTVDHVNELADRLRTIARLPERGRVDVAEMPASGPIDRTFARLAVAMRTGDTLPRFLGSDVMASIVESLTGPAPVATVGSRSGIDSRVVVRDCVDYAVSIQRIPSNGELCLASHVSERRLRQAFADQFDMPPTQFFRTWALGLARRRLRAAEVGTTTVSRVAVDAGFHHLGRFATYYRAMYGETPSATLRATAPSARAK